MTASAPTTSPTGDLQGTVAHLLVPLFAEGGNDDATAFQIAHTTLDAYQPQSGADYVNVARTLAFSMTALNLLRDIAKADLSMPEKLRLFGRANALNRSADQSERTMMQRRRLQQSAKADEWLAKPSAPPPDPTKDEAEVEAQVAEAMAVYMAECAQRKNQPTASAQPQPEPTQPPPAATPAPQQPIRLPGLPQGSTTPPNPNPPRGGKDRIAYILDQAAAGFPATPAPASRPRYAP